MGKRIELDAREKEYLIQERLAGRMREAALITKTGRHPVGPGHIAQKSRPVFKDDFLRNVIVSICFLVFSSKTFRFHVPNKGYLYDVYEPVFGGLLRSEQTAFNGAAEILTAQNPKPEPAALRKLPHLTL